MNSSELLKEEFFQSRSELGEIIGVWDIYHDRDSQVILYVPISSKKEMKDKRKQMEKDTGYIHVGVKITHKERISHDPGNTRRKGSFHRTEFLTADFESTKEIQNLEELRKRLEKDSQWLCGGPKPENSNS